MDNLFLSSNDMAIVFTKIYSFLAFALIFGIFAPLSHAEERLFNITNLFGLQDFVSDYNIRSFKGVDKDKISGKEQPYISYNIELQDQLKLQAGARITYQYGGGLREGRVFSYQHQIYRVVSFSKDQVKTAAVGVTSDTVVCSENSHIHFPSSSEWIKIQKIEVPTTDPKQATNKTAGTSCWMDFTIKHKRIKPGQFAEGDVLPIFESPDSNLKVILRKIVPKTEKIPCAYCEIQFLYEEKNKQE